MKKISAPMIRQSNIKRATFLTFLLCPFAIYASTACKNVDDESFISATIEYYFLHEQTIGSIQYLDDGAVVKKLYEPFKSIDDFKTINPECCKLLGLTDSEGQMFKPFEIFQYDIYTTVGVRPLVRLITENGTSIVKGVPVRIPLNSCAQVITELVGE